MSHKILSRYLNELIFEINTHSRQIRYYLSKKHQDMYDPCLWVKSLYYMQIDILKSTTSLLSGEGFSVAIVILARTSVDMYVNTCNVINKTCKYKADEKNKVHGKYAKFIKKFNSNSDVGYEEKEQILKYLNDISVSFESLINVKKKYLKESEKRKLSKVPEFINDFYSISSEYVHAGHTALAQNFMEKKDKEYRAYPLKKNNIVIYYSLYIMVLVTYVLIGKIYAYACSKSSTNNLNKILASCEKITNKVKIEIKRLFNIPL